MRGLLFVPAFAATFGTIVLAQSSITPMKPLTSPGLNTTPAFPSATMWKNSPNPASGGLGLGTQNVPGISPVTNSQASKGGGDAEQINRTEQKAWLPKNFRLSLPGSSEKVNKVDEVKKKQSINPDAVGAARDFATPPSINKKSGGDSAGLNFKSATPKTTKLELMFDPYESSTGTEKQKMGPLESGLGGGGQDKSKFGTWGPGYTPDKSSNDKSQFGTWGPGYTPDKSSNDKSQFGTWGSSYTGKSSTDKSKFGTWGPGYTDKSSTDSSSKNSSTNDNSKTEKQEGKNEPSQ